MGEPMARNVLKAGLPLVVYDIDDTKNRLLEAEGVTMNNDGQITQMLLVDLFGYKFLQITDNRSQIK